MRDYNLLRERFWSLSSLDQIKSKLDEHDLQMVEHDVSNYKQYANSKVDEVDFQKKAIDSTTKDKKGLWCGELGPGSGKTIIAALA